jgi:hypothetical protein
LWNQLKEDQRTHDLGVLPSQPDEILSRLSQASKNIDRDEWREEKHMYPNIVAAVKSTIYPDDENVHVIDTSAISKKEFRPDMSVSERFDPTYPFFLRYFMEFKFPSTALLMSTDNCGQVVDYLNYVHEKQPLLSQLIAILSNFDAAIVFIAEYGKALKFSYWTAPSLVDAIPFADRESRHHYRPAIG